jgi:heme A synthase
MSDNAKTALAPAAAWHSSLLATAAVFTVLLIAMGGILDVTQSIRDCPDWPGCFGKALPPMEISPILEMTHRTLAATSGLLIVAAAVAGWIWARRDRWVMAPMLLACALVVEVSYFGRQAVLKGLTAGWAAVDVGSALLVVALTVMAAVIADAHRCNPAQPARLTFHSPFARLVLVTAVVVWMVLLSSVLVAGPKSITTSLGWPFYSAQVFQADTLDAGNILRLLLSVIGIGLVIAVLVQAWRTRLERTAIFHAAGRVGILFLFLVLLQALMLVTGFNLTLRLAYSVGTAVFWGLLLVLLFVAAVEKERHGDAVKE